MRSHSILAPVQRWAERDGDRTLFAFLDAAGTVTERYTYSAFLRRSAAIASHIHASHPMAAGERVLLIYPPGIEMIAAFFACVRLGLIPVPVYPPSSHGFEAALFKTAFIARDCGASAVLTERAYYWSLRVNRLRHKIATLSWRGDFTTRLPWIVSNDADPAAPVAFEEGHSDVLFLQYTSGSTSDPKGVMVRHANLLDNCAAVVDHRPVGVSWLPQYHDMGLIGYYLFFAMSGGTTYGFSPLDFIQRPCLWLEAITRFRGTASSAPNFAYEYCLRPGKIPEATLESLDLGSLRFLMTAAEPVRTDVYRRFLRTFGRYGLRASSFFGAYGLAEYTLAVSNYGRTVKTFDRHALATDEAIALEPSDGAAPSPSKAGVSLLSCGRPLGETEVRIVAPQPPHVALPDGAVGEIWIRGPSKCAGYWQRPEQTHAVFEARIDGADEQDAAWLRSGDLGFLCDGELYISGRLKDMIIVRGLNYYPQDIERLVEQDAGVRKGCVAAFAHETDKDEALIVVAEVKDRRRLPDAEAANRKLITRLGIAADRFVWLPPRTIAKTSSGKIARHRVRDEWLGGGLPALAEARPITATPDSDAIWTGNPDSGREHDADDELGALFRRRGLVGDETFTLAEAGLDSISLVVFATDLKDRLEATGHGALTASVDLRVLQQIAVAELRALFDDLERASPGARVRFARGLSHLRDEHQRLEQDAMRRDARHRGPLPFDDPNAVGPADHIGDVLLTGGTGFFGPFLLKSLLEQGDERIQVLVRCRDAEHGKQRLRDALASVGPSARTMSAFDARVAAIPSDLARANLGLDDRTWTRLANSVGAIVHNGAHVNYLGDYATMRDANVGGTNEAIRLALSGRATAFNHISTTFIFGWSAKPTLLETDANEAMRQLDFGYSQTKWVAEQVVFDAMSRGLVARVFRPALLTPSVSGGGYNIDISIRLLAFMLKHGLGTTAHNQVSFSPADVAADNIVAIARLPDSAGRVFHVTRDDYANMVDITTLLAELTGVGFEQLPLDAFVPAVIARCGPDDLLYPLLDFFVRSIDNITAMSFKRYDNTTFRHFRSLAPGGVDDPPLRDVVLGIVRFMRRHSIAAAGPVATDAAQPESEGRRAADATGRKRIMIGPPGRSNIIG